MNITRLLYSLIFCSPFKTLSRCERVPFSEMALESASLNTIVLLLKINDLQQTVFDVDLQPCPNIVGTINGHHGLDVLVVISWVCLIDFRINGLHDPLAESQIEVFVLTNSLFEQLKKLLRELDSGVKLFHRVFVVVIHDGFLLRLVRTWLSDCVILDRRICNTRQ